MLPNGSSHDHHRLRRLTALKSLRLLVVFCLVLASMTLPPLAASAAADTAPGNTVVPTVTGDALVGFDVTGERWHLGRHAAADLHFPMAVRGRGRHLAEHPQGCRSSR